MKISMSSIKEKLSADTYSRNGDVITVRMGFFYSMGKSTQTFVDAVLQAFPSATIIDSGERWVAFRGGDTVAQGSHWYVKFTI